MSGEIKRKSSFEKNSPLMGYMKNAVSLSVAKNFKSCTDAVRGINREHLLLSNLSTKLLT